MSRERVEIVLPISVDLLGVIGEAIDTAYPGAVILTEGTNGARPGYLTIEFDRHPGDDS